jgi:GT2 family glycosyltransferase
MNPFVVIVIATFRRAVELKRLFASLETVTIPFAVVVVDNAGDSETGAVVNDAAARLNVQRLLPGSNLGCGGGLLYGEKVALERYADRITHLCIMDDDTEASAGTLERLVTAAEQEGAAAACPMITNAEGKIGWFPGLTDKTAFDEIRRVSTPAEYIAVCGTKPVRFSWATGVCLLVKVEAVKEVGLHRADFWIRGEDLEYSLRLTSWRPGIFVPDTLVRHLPRPMADSPEALQAERKKHGAMLQNIAYISFHLPHGLRILRTLPGNLWRYVKAWGIASLPQGLCLYWQGAVLKRPAGFKKD